MEAEAKHTRPFTNLQHELFKLSSSELDEKTLLEIKDLIARHLLQKSRQEAERAAAEKGLTLQELSKLTGIELDQGDS